MTRTVLILSPHFPPSSLAGVHRARHLAKALPLHGWRPIIVRADPMLYGESGDPELERLVPDSVEQVFTGGLPLSISRRFGIGDVGLRAYRQFGQALLETARRTGAEVVLLTGSPFYPMLLAQKLRHVGLKVVLDFQDPWVSSEGTLRPVLSKGGLAHLLAVTLEPHAVRFADAITSVSEEQNRQMLIRYPFLAGIPMEAIPIGGDPDDFVALRAAPPTAEIHPLDPRKINLCYVGTFMPRSGPLMAAVMAAAAALVERRPDLSSRLVLNFVGTSNQPDATGLGPAAELAKKLGVAYLVRETPRRVPYLQALSLLARANGLILVGSDEAHYTASKIYPNLMAARPYLSLFHARSSAHSILSSAAGGRCFSFQEVAELGSLVTPIAEAMEVIAFHPEHFQPPDQAAYASYTALGVAGRFATLFDSLVK